MTCSRIDRVEPKGCAAAMPVIYMSSVDTCVFSLGLYKQAVSRALSCSDERDSDERCVAKRMVGSSRAFPA
jgi:hypothetical protein